LGDVVIESSGSASRLTRDRPAAVQADLSLAAYDLVIEKGHANVTLDDMAAAGGVSRSTFLRYFHTKDQAIVVALKAYVESMADALRSRPRQEDDWPALRSAG
jgi:AcrR family transcriptional regulator